MTSFDRATTVVRTQGGPLLATAELDPAYSALRGTLGGYLVALAVRAVDPLLDGRTVRTVSTSFLRPGRPGPADIEVEVVRTGRSVATFEVTVAQDARTTTRTRITAMTPADGAKWDHAAPLAVAPVAECVPFTPPEGVIHFRQAQAVLDPRSLPFTHQERVVLSGHMRPLEPRPIDVAWLVTALDWFPPSPFVRLDPPVGGVSVDYTVHVHRTLEMPMAPEDWLAAEFRAEISADGLALEHGRLADPTGRVLAESFHTRWTA